MERALSFAEQLSSLRGRPEDVLPQAERLLSRFQVPSEALEELREVLELLDLHDLPGVAIELAPGMARGIAYYSGLIFELYADSGSADPPATPICGGGRYDGLALALTGSHSFPALGFSFAVELLQAAASAPRARDAGRVGILVRRDEQRLRAHQLAEIVRAKGIAVTVHDQNLPAETPLPDLAERLGTTALLVLPASIDAGRTPTVVFAPGEEDPKLTRILLDADALVDREGQAPERTGGRA